MGQVVYLGLCLLGCLIFNPRVEGADDDTVTAKSPCPEGALLFRRNCYEVFSNALPWRSAEKECQTLEEGAHLVSIQDIQELRFLSSYLRRQNAGYNVWIGLHDPVSYRGQNWAWSSGTPYDPSASFWNGWRPSSYSSLCVAISPSGSSRWIQRDCSNPFPYVCKYRPFY
ncbi:lithostathine-like [Eublepharis macularius]|uniref:Lithostathine-like n=1 Tax=Eublepharis macularius TaxID=481883 RepID=A0AA97JUS9_EUBMA|nr:lithostathine-like [Eublepharis macularius]